MATLYLEEGMLKPCRQVSWLEAWLFAFPEAKTPSGL